MTTTKEARIALRGAIDRAENERLRAALESVLRAVSLDAGDRICPGPSLRPHLAKKEGGE